MIFSRLSVLLLALITACAPLKRTPYLLDTDALKIKPLTKNSFVHITFLESEQFGHVPCNGLVYVQGDEAIVFDTPPDDAGSALLIAWIEKDLQKRIKAVFINHFHGDCLGGLAAFHAHGIPSYANRLTIELASKDTQVVALPQHGFDEMLVMDLGGQQVVNRFFGEAHTRDNIVSYIPSEQVLFGGCQLKAVNASKGNLADANIGEWSATMAKVKQAYPDLKFAVPGHGEPGGMELLDFTIGLFRER
jgi:metallo-beta-lactamase class B